jgi:hypothetical protein
MEVKLHRRAECSGLVAANLAVICGYDENAHGFRVTERSAAAAPAPLA